MNYRELDAQLVGRCAQKKSLGHTLIAERGADRIIRVLKKHRGERVVVAEFEPLGKVRFVVNSDYIYQSCFQNAINQLLPAYTYTIGRYLRHWYPVVHWKRNRRDVRDWRQVYDHDVLVPYTPGDIFDADANYLHAQNRNNF